MRVFIMDNHRPIHLENIYSAHNVVIFDNQADIEDNQYDMPSDGSILSSGDEANDDDDDDISSQEDVNEENDEEEEKDSDEEVSYEFAATNTHTHSHITNLWMKITGSTAIANINTHLFEYRHR